MLKQKNIVIIGFMASGKTKVSNKLGVMLKKDVISTDKCIEERQGQSIVEIFDQLGEKRFRIIEKEIIKEISNKKGIIIDCGGGVVLDKENINNLTKNGIFFYLSATPQFIYNRVKGKKNRPILNVRDPLEKITELLQIRQPIYAQAEHSIEVDNRTIKHICEEIKGILSRTCLP